MRPAPAAVQLPRPIADARHQERPGVIRAHARHLHVQAVAQGVAQPHEVGEVVDAEAVPRGDRSQDAMEALEVARLLDGHAGPLGLPDVLPGLLPHGAQELVRIAGEVDDERPARLDEHRREPDPGARQVRAQLGRVGDLGIAEEARAEPARQRGAQSDDRRGEALGGDEQTPGRVRDRDPERQLPQEDLRDPRALEDESLRAPPGRGLHRGPSGGLQELRASGRLDEPVPRRRLRSGRWARDDQAGSPLPTGSGSGVAASSAGAFAGRAESSRAVNVHSG